VDICQTIAMLMMTLPFVETVLRQAQEWWRKLNADIKVSLECRSTWTCVETLEVDDHRVRFFSSAYFLQVRPCADGSIGMDIYVVGQRTAATPNGNGNKAIHKIIGALNNRRARNQSKHNDNRRLKERLGQVQRQTSLEQSSQTCPRRQGGGSYQFYFRS